MGRASAPTISSSGVPRVHQQLDLGRPGVCAASVGVKLVGMPVDTFVAKTVGVCCERCHVTDACVAWSMEHLECTLFSTTITGYQTCEGACFAGNSLSHPVNDANNPEGSDQVV